MDYYEKEPVSLKELPEFPGISAEDLKTVDRLFTPYLFFENGKGGRQIWTSCCHHQAFVPENGRTSTPADRLVLGAQHNRCVSCPFCGRIVTAKNRRLLRKGLSLEEYHGVAFFHVAEDGNTIWAQGYWATRDFLNDPTGPTLYKVTRVYQFKPGEAKQWDIYGNDRAYPRRHPKIQEPCINGGMYGSAAGYTPVGLWQLKRSFLKYTGYEEPMTGTDRVLWERAGTRDDLIRYLAAAARYPRQVELMRKAKLDEPLHDLVWRWKKNADVLNWKETDPCKAFGLTRQELKQFVAGGKKLDTLRVLKRVRKLGGRMALDEAEDLRRRVDFQRITQVLDKAQAHGVPVGRLLKYLDSFTGPRCHGQGVTMSFVAHFWVDYMDMAEQLGYDLSNPIWQMPKELEQRHDQLAEAVNAVKMAQRREEAEKRRLEAEKRYGFAMDGYFIRVPKDGEEIAAEGRELKHCVGGYANRHLEGVLTILFLRRQCDPDKPYVTIEMRGTELQQVHGYKNEREACPENPEKRPIQELHKELMDTWLAWVKKGSKRDERGEPVLPKPKKKAATAA